MSPFQEDEASPHHQEVVTDDHSAVLAEMLDGSDSIDTNNNSNNTVTVTVTVPSSPSDETTTTTSTISTNSTRKETHHDLLYESNRHSKKYSSSSSSINYHHHSKKKCCYGKALRDKDETKAMIGALIVENRLPLANVYGNGPILVSNIPQSCLPQQQQQKKTTTTTSANTFSTTNSTPDIILGIDEAGRGSVMGPMVYGAAYWSTSLEETIPKGFRDSKTLKEEDRFRLFEEVLNHKEIGFAVRAILPSEISRNMLRPSHEVYNLNEMSHDAAIVLIRTIVESGVTIKTAYIDTVGSPTYYARKLQREFPTIAFVVESKADAKYPPCSAASVVAKVMRDRLLENWKFTDDGPVGSSAGSSSFSSMDGTAVHPLSRDFGSGYPSDPKCKAWMEELHDPVFGYNDFVRFSWAPTKARLEEKGVPVLFRADLDDDEDDNLQSKKGMANFLSGTKKRKRMGYFDKRNIEVVTNLR